MKFCVYISLLIIGTSILLVEIECKAAGIPENLEDVYGDLETNDPQDKNVQNDEDIPDEDYTVNEEDLEEDVVENPNEPSEEPPAITSKPQEFYVVEGDLVLLPCKVSRNINIVTVWRRSTPKVPNFLLYQSSQALHPQPNIKRLIDNTLELHINSEDDFGEYTCKIAWAANNNPEIVHKVIKKTAPKILSVTADPGAARIGEKVLLTCNATGHPTPNISWHKNNIRFTAEGPTFEIPEVTLENAGVYRCLADNGVEHPNHGHTELFVYSKPVVSIEKFLISSDKEHDAEFHCKVLGYPAPVVVWQKDNENIVDKHPKIELSRKDDGREHILTIRELEENDFGSYTCLAVNTEGKERKNVTLVKTPAIGGFVKPPKGGKDVTLKWKVESKSPILEHELQYRKTGEVEWKTLKPEVTSGSSGVYEIETVLKGLEPGIYETRARSKNSHGWSDYSEVMPFEGVHHKHKNKKHNKNAENAPENRHIPAQQQQPDDSPTPTPSLSPVGESTSGGISPQISGIVLSISFLILSFTRH